MNMAGAAKEGMGEAKRALRARLAATAGRLFSFSLSVLVLLALLGTALPTGGAAARGKPGDYDYLVLVLSWSPTYCEGEGRQRRDPQCTGTRPYGFVLHGLWPQWQRGWPEYCRARGQRRAWVPSDVIRNMLDIMPSRRLVIHEYRKHGTCFGGPPAAYFATARKLYEKIRIPPRFVRLEKPLVIAPREIEAAFLKANRAIGLGPEMIAVSCNRRGRLRGVRICFSPGGALRACGQNELQRRLCRRPRIVMPPVRGGGGRRAAASQNTL